MCVVLSGCGRSHPLVARPTHDRPVSAVEDLVSSTRHRQALLAPRVLHEPAIDRELDCLDHLPRALARRLVDPRRLVQTGESQVRESPNERLLDRHPRIADLQVTFSEETEQAPQGGAHLAVLVVKRVVAHMLPSALHVSGIHRVIRGCTV